MIPTVLLLNCRNGVRPVATSIFTFGADMACVVTPLRVSRGSITLRHDVLFLINGYRSSRRNVTCGIRQGIPLVPLLFILALDSVYRVLQARVDKKGVPITSGGGTTEFKVRDMLILLMSTFVIDLQLCRLPLFSVISLTCPVFKDYRPILMVVELGPRGSAQFVSNCGLTMQTPGVARRYLGVLVGQQVAMADNWQ